MPLTAEDVEDRFVRKFGVKVVPTTPYVGYEKPQSFLCLDCGYQWDSCPKNVLVTGFGCPNCGRSHRDSARRQTPEAYEKRLKAVHPEITCLEPYGRSTRLLFKHSCGHYWRAKAVQLLRLKVGCPNCAKAEGSRTSNKHKIVEIGGRRFTVQGGEDTAIRWLISKGVRPAEIFTSLDDMLPVIPYFFDGRYHRHFPDLLVRGMLIEVKGTYTFGIIGDRHRWLDRNKAKAAMAHSLQIPYRMLVVDRNKVNVLPKDWFNLSRHALERLLE